MLQLMINLGEKLSTGSTFATDWLTNVDILPCLVLHLDAAHGGRHVDGDVCLVPVEEGPERAADLPGLLQEAHAGAHQAAEQEHGKGDVAETSAGVSNSILCCISISFI